MDLIYEFIKNRMTEEEQRRISSSVQVLQKLGDDEDSENEIKDELYRVLLNEVNWSNLIQRIHYELPEEEDDDEHKSDVYDNDSEDEEQQRLEDEDYDY